MEHASNQSPTPSCERLLEALVRVLQQTVEGHFIIDKADAVRVTDARKYVETRIAGRNGGDHS